MTCDFCQNDISDQAAPQTEVRVVRGGAHQMIRKFDLCKTCAKLLGKFVDRAVENLVGTIELFTGETS